MGKQTLISTLFFSRTSSPYFPFKQLPTHKVIFPKQIVLKGQFYRQSQTSIPKSFRWHQLCLSLMYHILYSDPWMDSFQSSKNISHNPCFQ